MSFPDANEAAQRVAPPCVALSAAPDPHRWFTDEIHAHDRQLKSWLRNQFPSVQDVEDVVQESYLRIWKTHASERIHSAKSFLFTVARHLALDHVRRAKISPIQAVGDLTVLSVPEERESVQDQLTTEEKLTLLASAIRTLPSRMREIVILQKIEGRSQIEVAERLGIRRKTVENLAARATVKCREYLREKGVEFFTL